MAHGFTSQTINVIEEVAIEKNSQLLDYDIDGKLIYSGDADAGTAKSSPGWAIKKLFYDPEDQLVEVFWANGNTDKINIWDDRASLTYS